jgi:adenylate kinase family enzyme
MQRRIHILGASGSGTTTLGAALSEKLRIPHFDSDTYFWVKTDIPYTQKTDIQTRVDSLGKDLRAPEWVLSGSLCEWGDFAIPLFTLVVFLWIPQELRLARLKAREIRRYGEEALSSGGWFHKNHVEFMDYARSYDSGGLDIRSRQLHDRWLTKIPCPVIMIEEPLSIGELVSTVKEKLVSG